MTQTSGSSRRGTSWAGEDPGNTRVPGRLSAAQSRPPVGVSLGNGRRKPCQTPGGPSASPPRPPSPQGLLALVVIATELYQNATLADGLVTPQHPRGFQESFATVAKSRDSFQQARRTADSPRGPPAQSCLGGQREAPRGAVAHPGTQSNSCTSRSCRGTLGSGAMPGATLWHRAVSTMSRQLLLRGRRTHVRQRPPRGLGQRPHGRPRPARSHPHAGSVL